MCSTGNCGGLPYRLENQYDYSYPLGDFVLVYKLPKSVPNRLRKRDLDLAYDPCYKSYRLIKRRIDDDDDSEKYSTEYINIGGTKYKCSCKHDCCKTVCVCIKCRDMKRICRRKKQYIKKKKKCDCEH